MAALMVLSMVAALGSRVIELSNVGMMTSAWAAMPQAKKAPRIVKNCLEMVFMAPAVPRPQQEFFPGIRICPTRAGKTQPVFFTDVNRKQRLKGARYGGA